MRLVAKLILLLTLAALTLSCTSVCFMESDNTVRPNVFMLLTDEGYCTGVAVKTPSNKTLLLTAGHCADLLEKQPIFLVFKDGVKTPIGAAAPMAVDKEHDLMLLDVTRGVVAKGLKIGAELKPHQHVHTLGGGGTGSPYRTDGEFVFERQLNYSAPGEPADIKTISITTALVRQGSSGGALLDDNGDLVGIISITDSNNFSGSVPQRFIRDILKGR